jgi:hypothetical protein
MFLHQCFDLNGLANNRREYFNLGACCMQFFGDRFLFVGSSRAQNQKRTFGR